MRNKTATFRFDDRDHEILNSLAKARGQNKTQVLKRMLREEEARAKKDIFYGLQEEKSE